MGLLGVVGVAVALAIGSAIVKSKLGVEDTPITVVAQTGLVMGTTQLVVEDMHKLLDLEQSVMNVVFCLTATAFAYVSAYYKEHKHVKK